MWKIIAKRIWLVALLGVLGVSITAIITHYVIVPQYEASTKLIVNKSSDSANVDKLDITTINSNIQLIKTYKEIIKTPRIMDLVVQQHPELNQTSEQLIKEITVNSVNDTQVMTVIARNKSYKQAANEVNVVSKVFQKEIPSLMKVDNVSILNEADPNDTPAPVSPKMAINIAVSLVLSLMVGIGLAFMLDYFDDTVKTEEEIAELLDLPTLSVIPLIKSQDVHKKHDKSLAKQETVTGGTVNV
ncbi:lipopolysaccharide biosynthesis protein [Gordoniibacillus kamchatkensis]|uniref:Lipopolysaccharide biosynthesis protein n=2 Tax=Gordoniibacillus kamchatkensis TaxID=1590651 RepID=A0ABR5AIG8_9BACL|nr:lipopolysaccharide biosynthesis protein [Paenibacillus sp. VKM B-2647]